MSNFIDQLFVVLQERKANPTAGSYTASLLADEDEIVKKIGEEAIEVILAAKGQGGQRIVEETADLVYHLLVLLVSRNLSWDDIQAELASRHQ
ncbi:Phosphoribosyl-AMP cyclohydrolase / Phosphoribosyl-ATP pyrophosphatase [hydrothermal vent metagenome]|uniref:phosphoribosyl-ATP diphosphatase n=1 Tax=hydrothermal vent metagenome TaxID=652676 RepID=A0A3B0UWQ7_9ZZZZ